MAAVVRISSVLSTFLQDRRFLWPAYILVICLLSALCFGSLKDHLLDVHDQETFQDNIAIGEDFSFFFSPEKQQPTGRPAADLVKYIAYEIGGNDPGFFHLLVVAVHTLAALLVASLSWRLGMGLRLSLAGGLLFLVNVAHFQAVHHISALDYPLALALGLGALHCYLTWMSTRRWCWLLGFYLASVVSIATLAVMVFLWPFCLYLSWSRGQELKTTVRPLLPLLALMAVELVLIVAITPGETNAGRAIGLYLGKDAADHLSSMGKVLLWFSSRLVTTAHWLLVPLYELQPWELYAGAGVLTGLAVLVRWKGSPGSLWSVWVLLSLLPFLPLTDTEGILQRPSGPSRYLYLATAGTSLLLAWGLEEASRGLRSWGRYLYPGVLAAILICSCFSLKRSEAISRYASGRNYVARGDIETGVEQLRRAIEQGRDAIHLEDAYERICYMGTGMGEAEAEEAVLNEALVMFPENLDLNMYRLALDWMKPDSLLSGRAREQLEAFKSGEAPLSVASGSGKQITFRDREIIQAAKRQIAAFYHNTGLNLGTGLVTLENLDRAILAYRRALEFDPDRTMTSKSLVTALASAGRQSEAVMAALEAVERNPDAPPGLQVTASFALLASGRAEEAVALCHRALKDEGVTEVQRETAFRIYGGILKGAYGEVSNSAAVRMGMDLWDGGRVEEAVRAFRQALEKDADNRRAHFGLALSLLAQGQVEEAERLYAEGVARFGQSAAEEAGVPEGLRKLIAQGIQVEPAQAMLTTHWPE